ARLGQSARRSLPQAMCRAVRQPRLVAPVPEPVAKRRSPERAIVSRRQECEVTTGGRGNDGCKLRVHRDGELGASLLLLDVQKSVANVLCPHAENIAAALAGIEQQRQRQTGA